MWTVKKSKLSSIMHAFKRATKISAKWKLSTTSSLESLIDILARAIIYQYTHRCRLIIRRAISAAAFEGWGVTHTNALSHKLGANCILKFSFSSHLCVISIWIIASLFSIELNEFFSREMKIKFLPISIFENCDRVWQIMESIIIYLRESERADIEQEEEESIIKKKLIEWKNLDF